MTIRYLDVRDRQADRQTADNISVAIPRSAQQHTQGLQTGQLNGRDRKSASNLLKNASKT